MPSSIFNEAKNAGGIFDNISQALQIVNGQDPEQAVRRFLQSRGVTPEQMDTALKQAQQLMQYITRNGQRGL